MKRARAGLETTRRHPRHAILFAIVAGLLCGPAGPLPLLAAALAAAALAGRTPLALAVAIAALGAGTLAQARAAHVGAPLDTSRIGAIDTTATLLEPVRVWRDGRAVARVRLAARGSPRGLAGAIVVARSAQGSAPPGARVGSELRLRGEPVPLEQFEDYQRRRGARAAIVVRSWNATGRGRGGLTGALDAARERASDGLGRGLAPPEAALLRGMVLGQDEAISDAVEADFRRSGLAHLLAVSGQNVMLLCTLVLALGALAGIPLRARLCAAIALVVIYVPLAGGGPSIQRAGVMGVAGLTAALAGRPASRWYALGLAAAVTLAVNPLAAAEPGWQLSFAAVAGLLALGPPLRAALARGPLPDPVAEAAAITIAATVATAPLMALHFEQVSLASLPANLLAAAAVAPVMWLGMTGMALSQVSPALAAPLNLLAEPLLGYVEWVAHVAAGAPLAALPLRLGGVGGLALGYAVLGAAALAVVRIGRAARRRVDAGRAGLRPAIAPRTLAAAALAAVVAVAGVGIAAARRHHQRGPDPRELVVSFLDVGQGDATLLQQGGASVLVDTGPPGGPILRRLAEAGVGRLDLLVLTHAEIDHEGMALPVIAAHRPRLVLDGGAGWPSSTQSGLAAALARSGGRAVPARAGQLLRLGRLRIRVLWPPPPSPGWRPEGNPNDRAIVALVRAGAFDMLLPADAESNVTAGLDLPRLDALKVAHHGSVDDGLGALLERTRPQVAAIEVGAHNTYGHPAPSTLAALRGVDHVVRTDIDGTVRLHVSGAGMRLEGAGS